jgi:sugar lactone lactonase YvrE
MTFSLAKLKPAYLFLLFLSLVIVSCSKKGSDPTPPVDNTPKVTALSVTTGIYNTEVIITGNNFSSTAANNQVFFNGKAATITAATATKLTVKVPLAAGTGPVSVKVSGSTEVTGPTFTYQQSWVVTTFAGTGAKSYKDGTITTAEFNFPMGLAFDGSGNLFVSEEGNDDIRKITPDGIVSTIAGNRTEGHDNGNGTAASFWNPEGLTVDNAGNIYVADYANNIIRKIDPSKNVTTFAGQRAIGFKNGQGIAASFDGPTDIKIDASGFLYVSDLTNEAIRKITPDGLVSTYADIKAPINSNTFNFPSGIAFDTQNNLYVTTFSFKVQKITPGGVISTLAGSGVRGTTDGPAGSASFYETFLAATDKDGNVYVTDSNLIRKITPDGKVTTLAGIEAQTGATDGSSATATFNHPIGIAVDKNGNIFVADTQNNIIRKMIFE